jgi:signal transduction histidine kinase
LTGGIAHDFNNLLMVVVGNLDRVMRSLPDEAAERRNLDNALAATERAAQLTDQLLTFARRQPVQVCKQNCSDIVLSLAGMIERTIGSNIELTLDIGPDMLFARIDRNQLENAVLNLAINARDAMPDGGDLTIATRRGDDGGAVISLSDTGMGMDAETLRRATEPFFTTKPVGQGTGLGLSQVYGFVEQMGGNMGIFSAAGTGTVVVLSFPPSEGG